MPQKRMPQGARREQARGMGSSMQQGDDSMGASARGMLATTEAPKRKARSLAASRGRSLKGRAAAARMSSARRATSAAKPAKSQKAAGRKAAPRKGKGKLGTAASAARRTSRSR